MLLHCQPLGTGAVALKRFAIESLPISEGYDARTIGSRYKNLCLQIVL